MDARDIVLQILNAEEQEQLGKLGIKLENGSTLTHKERVFFDNMVYKILKKSINSQRQHIPC